MRKTLLLCTVMAALACVGRAFGASPFVVTTADDPSSSSGGVSLRDALAAAARGEVDPGLDGFYEITFGDELFAGGDSAVTVRLDDRGTLAVSNNVRVCGRKGVTVRAETATTALQVNPGVQLAFRNLSVSFAASAFALESSGQPTSGVFVASEGVVTWTGCTFAGEGAENGVLLASAGTTTDRGARIEDCSFVGEKCGTLTLLGARSYLLVNCTFANISAPSNTAIVHLAGANASVVANCTICYCRAASGALYFEPSLVRLPYVVNTLAVFNSNTNNASCDIYAKATGAGKVRLCHAGYVEKGGSGYYETNCFQLTSTQESALFADELRTVTVDGVARWYRPLATTGAASERGCYVFHDAAWTNVTCRPSLRYQTQGAVVVCGAATKAGEFLARDIATRPVADLPTTYQQLLDCPDVRAVPGSYAALTEVETGSAGTIVINDNTDGLESTFNAYDGKISFREAVNYAATHPEWRDADGNCTLTFGSAFFGNVRARVWSGAQRQIELTGFTNGILSVKGPSDGRKSLTFDGGATHRLFYIGAGNRVQFDNVSFTRGAGQVAGSALLPSGGAILNAGDLSVSNAGFRVCTGVGATSEGGAIYTCGGATTRIARCTFAECSAGGGGALAAASGATLTAVSSTFLDNAATVASGGAAYVADGAARATFAGCTFTRNEAARRGGAVASDASTRVLYLVDDILAGNTAAAEADLYAAGSTPVVGCWYGCRNDTDAGAKDIWDQDVAVTGGVAQADIFSRVTDAGVAEDVTQSALGVTHRIVPLRDDVTFDARWVRHDATWTSVGYSDEPDGEVMPLYGGMSPMLLQLTGLLLAYDQLGSPMGVTPALGAVATYEEPQGRLPVSADNPLRVTTADFTALQGAIAYAVQHPNLASNGWFTISFLPGLVIPFTEELALSAFAETGLRLVGPVTFDGQGKVRLFKLAAENALRLENVTLANGYASGKDGTYGGAVYAKDARLEASNCVFQACKAGVASAATAYGGAVEYWDDASGTALSSGDFTECRFTGCAVSAQKTLGRILCRASAATALRGCLYDGSPIPGTNDVWGALRVRLDRPQNAGQVTNRLYFGTLSAALSECCRGDTLVRLDKNVVVPQDLRWPDGVSFADETALQDAKAATLLAAARANLAALAAAETVGGRPLYRVNETATRVALALNAEALEEDVFGAGSEIDLSGRDDTVTVVPATVVSGLWYGLGRSVSPEGPYEVSSDGWVRADADGLPCALTAPKSGESGYYRVIVRE